MSSIHWRKKAHQLQLRPRCIPESPVIYYPNPANEVFYTTPQVARTYYPTNGKGTEESMTDSEKSDFSALDETKSEIREETNSQENPMFPDPTQLFMYAGIHLGTTEVAEALLQIFDAHAWKHMGFVANEKGEIAIDLPSAQLAIDSLAFFAGKLEKKLSSNDMKDLQRRLNDLRVNYLAKMQER